MKNLSILFLIISLLFCVSCTGGEKELGGQTLADGIINENIEMSQDDMSVVIGFFNCGKWEKELGNCISDVKVQLIGRALTYHSECGNFNDAKNGEHFKLTDAQREVVNALLSKYVSLGEELPERKVTDIIDTTRELEIELPCVEQVFFEDENCRYIFGMPIADYVIVQYSDGTSKQLTDALADGDIEITDLKTYHISYYEEPIAN